MRLSEAIRKGSVGTYKIKEQLRDGNGGRCAMGAALFAAGHPDGSMFQYRTAFPEAGALKGEPCPECGVSPGSNPLVQDSLISSVVHLNNDHDWTREQIADYVQLQEALHGIGQPDSAQVNRETLTELVTA